MATRDSTTDEANYLNSDPLSLSSSLMVVIEAERARLEKALTILGCTTVAINNDPRADEHQFLYGDMIEWARQMINETTNRLDSVHLRGVYEVLASHEREVLIEAHASVQGAPSAGDSDNGLSAV